MGFFSQLFTQPKQSDVTSNPIDRRSIPAEEIDRAQSIEASEKFKKQIYKKYYSDYPEEPFISHDRELYTNWSEQAEMFSGQIVEKRMMVRYTDGLLPGHVYMLYWILKIHRKRVPSYFEYQYGICFSKEKAFLRKNGFIDENDELTLDGHAALSRHKEVIEERHPKPKPTGGGNDSPQGNTPIQINVKRKISSKTAPEQGNIPTCDSPLLASEFAFINKMLVYASKLAGIKEAPSIDILRLAFGIDLWKTHYEYMPFTSSGKKSKYPLMLRYAYEETKPPPNECFGELHYLQDGNIGKARLIFWRQQTGHFFYLGQTSGKLVVKRVEESSPPDCITLYKE